MEYILEAQDVVKKYRGIAVLNKLNIHIEKSAIHGLIGKNGHYETSTNNKLKNC